MKHRRFSNSINLRTLTRPAAIACAVVLSVLSGCDRVKEAMGSDAPVSRWITDSTLLASEPEVLYRVVPSTGSTALIVPMATIGSSGLRELHFGSRGWRAFDVAYLQSGSAITLLRGGRAVDGLTSHRGFWEPTPFDTTIKCNPPIAVALGNVSGGVSYLAASKPPQPLRYPSELSSADLESALQTIPLLVAPLTGVSSSQLRSYERKVNVIPSATGPSPTILVEYNDPRAAPDTAQPLGERPRHLIVVLDKGIYNYRPSWTYSTLGNRNDKPALGYLDAADVNGDGLVELFFGLRNSPSARFTRIMRYESEAWREAMTYWGYLCER